MERLDRDFKDFVFSIPPDCPTSTPVSSMKLASRKSSARRDTQAVSGLGNVDMERLDRNFEDSVFCIPPDCPTSTPVASVKLASRRSSASGGVAALDLSLERRRAIRLGAARR